LGRAVEPVRDGFDATAQLGRFQHAELDVEDAQVHRDVVERVRPGGEDALVRADRLKGARARREVLRCVFDAGVQPNFGVVGVLRGRHSSRDQSGGIGRVARDETLCGPAKTDVTDKRNRARRKVRNQANADRHDPSTVYYVAA
jgi:hypothetical protein